MSIKNGLKSMPTSTLSTANFNFHSYCEFVFNLICWKTKQTMMKKLTKKTSKNAFFSVVVYLFLVQSLFINRIRVLLVFVSRAIGKCQFAIPERKLQIENHFVFSLFYLCSAFHCFIFVLFPSTLQSFSAFIRSTSIHFIYQNKL